MNPYSEYKDSNIQWLGKIPTHWLIKSSKHIFSFISRGSAPTYTNEENSTMVVNQAIFSQGKWDISKIRYTTECFDNSRGALFPGDILIASTGGGVLGKVFYFTKAEEQYIADSHVTILRSNHKTINAKFYSYIFSISYNYINAVLALGSTNQTELQRDMLRCHKLPVPFLLEQQAIVDYLDRETAEMDALITEQEKLVSLLKQKRSAIIMEAVCRGLDPTVPMKESGVKWLGMVPENWNLTKIKFVTLLNPSYKQTIEANTEIGYLPMECVKNGYIIPRTIEYGKINSGLNFLQDGDIIIAKVTPCFENGNIAVVSGLKRGIGFGSSELFVFRCFNINTFFLFYCLQCNTLKNLCISTMVGTGGLKRIPASFIQNSFIPFPNDEIQHSIVNYLDHKTSEIDHLIAECETNIQLLKQRRTALISEAVTGKIDVRTA